MALAVVGATLRRFLVATRKTMVSPADLSVCTTFSRDQPEVEAPLILRILSPTWRLLVVAAREPFTIPLEKQKQKQQKFSLFLLSNHLEVRGFLTQSRDHGRDRLRDRAQDSAQGPS